MITNDKGLEVFTHAARSFQFLLKQQRFISQRITSGKRKMRSWKSSQLILRSKQSTILLLSLGFHINEFNGLVDHAQRENWRIDILFVGIFA